MLFTVFKHLSILKSALIVLSVAALSGCSESSDSMSSEILTNITTTSSLQVVSSNNTGVVSTLPYVSEDDTTSEDTIADAIDTPQEDVETSNVSIPDSLTQNTLPVRFEIIVPAYQSDELSVELVWGDVVLNATWQGDELWTASDEWPVGVNNSLIVTFYDRNGGVELGQAYVGRYFRHDDGPTELRIFANRFDTDQFDADGDGLSNLEESISGTDLIVFDEPVLSIFDYATPSPEISVTEDFESRLSRERPFSVSEVENHIIGSTVWTNFLHIEIDLDGNGTFSSGLDRNYYQGDRWSFSGVRTRSENAITWEVDSSVYENVRPDDYHQTNEINTVTVVDESTRHFYSELNYARRGINGNVGLFEDGVEIVRNLTARVLEGTSLCEPVSCFITHTVRDNSGQDTVTVFNVSKEADDPYWFVQKTTTVLEYLQRPNMEAVTTTNYFARHILFGKKIDVPDNRHYFICDFVDL